MVRHGDQKILNDLFHGLASKVQMHPSLILSDPAPLAHLLTEVQKTNMLISGGRDCAYRAQGGLSSLPGLYFCLVSLLVTPSDR